MSSQAIVASVLCALTLVACGDRPTPVDRSAEPARAPVTPAPQPSPAPAAPERETLIEPSRDLGGILPLKHGIFVSAGIPCSDPSNAALRRYDGEGLSGAHTHACRIKIVGQQGKSYDIEQSCIDAGQGPAPRSSETATIDIQDNLTFTLKRGGAGETFRYCAASELPSALKNW